MDEEKLAQIYEGAPGTVPDPIFRDGRAGRSLRVIGGHIVKGLAETPALPTVLYELADLGTRAVTGNLDKDSVLPGVAGAREFTHSVDEKAKEIGASVAGEELIPGMLSNPDRAHQAGNVFGLVASPLPIAGPALKIVSAIKQFDTGIKALNTAKNVVVNSAAVVSPVIPTKHVAGMATANAAIGGAVTAAAEMLASPDPQIVAQGDNIAQQSVSPPVLDQYKQNTAQATLTLMDALKQASDTAIGGYQGASYGNKELENAIRAASGELPKEFDITDYGKEASIVGGTLLIGTLAALTHNAKTRTMLRPFGGKEFSKPAMEGAEGAISKTDTSVLNVGEIARAQAFDAGLPVRKLSSDPEMMGYRFEEVAAAPHAKLATMMKDGSFGGNSAIQLRTSGDDIVAKITEATKQGQSDLLRNALNALAEQQHRIRAWRDELGGPVAKKFATNDPLAVRGYERWLQVTGNEKKFSFNQDDVKFADLRATEKAARANSLVAEILDDLKDVSNKLMDYRLEQGVITRAEHARLLKERPHFVALPIEGSHMSRLELSEAGGRRIPGDPIREIFPYITQSFKEVAHERLKSAFILEQLDLANKGVKNSIDILGKKLNPDKLTQYTREKAVIYRDATGARKAIEVVDPTVRMALRGDAGSGALRVTEGGIKVIAAPSRFLEWATTGPASALLGSPFALANAAYGTVATLANRPKGTTAGVIDKFVQGTIGKGSLSFDLGGKFKWDGKFGMRADPTFVAQTMWQAGENVVAVLAKYGAKALENSVASSIHGASASPGALATMGKAMSNYYKRSIIHDMEIRGLRGGATPMYRQKVQTLDDIERTLDASVLASKGWTSTRDFIHDIFGAVGNAPQGAFFRQNKGRVSEELLTTRTRNVMGDPSKSGLAKSGFGKAANQGIVVTPWGGVTVQATSRFLKAWKDNPAGTAMAVFGTVAVPSYMITNYNAMLGPEYLDYQINRRTPDQVAGSFYVGIPGAPPEQGVEIRLDQPMRPFKVLVDTILNHTLGFADGSIFNPENESLKEALQAGISERYGIWGTAMHSAVGQLGPAVNPLANAAYIGLGGKEVLRTYVDPPTRIVENRNRGATDSTSSHIDNKLFGYNVSAEMEAIVGAMGGQLGRAIMETLTGISQSKKDGLSGSDATSDFTDRFGQRIGQANREVAALWGHANVMSPSQEASTAAIRPRIEGLKKLEAASEKLRSLHGAGETMTGGRKREIDSLIGEGPVQFKDQQMTALAYSAQVFMRQYNTHIQGQLKDLYQQRSSLQSSTRLTPVTKVQALNKITEDIVNVNRRGLGMIRQWEYGQSKAFGRDISMDKIKLGEGIDQFKQLQ